MDQLLKSKIEEKLKEIYSDQFKEEYVTEMMSCISKYATKIKKDTNVLSEKNIYLISYGDSIYKEGEAPLQTLHTFLNNYAKDTITDVHLLPTFPFTSDDGFSVTDYRQIAPELGDWNDIRSFSNDFRMMLDFVANHMSKSSEWFQKFLNNDPKYKEFFVEKEKDFDTANVVRPRTSPLFHKYDGVDGEKEIWTTFSEDQVDVNVKNFSVLLELTDVLLYYAEQGATSIRLDAIGFLWKESGTSCMHLPQTHAIISMWRLIFDYLQPNMQIITETNVPHEENISYFGDGKNEANMVYQFSLPPLVLHSMTSHDASKMTEWAKTISKVSDTSTYFNFLASHDGIGMRPVTGILSDDEIDALIEKVKTNGGRASYKTNPDGSQSVYELNINYGEALVNKGEDTTDELIIQKILAAHAILLMSIGVPAIYYHSLLGSQNDYKGLEESGINRRINREKLEYNELVQQLETNQRRKLIFSGMKQLTKIRREHSAFSPYASQTVVDLGTKFFALKRENDEECIYGIVNVDCHDQMVELPVAGTNLMDGRILSGKVVLRPYEAIWLKEEK